MKVSIEGFNQEYAVFLKKKIELENNIVKTIKLDCIDLVILRWFVDFYPKMRKINDNGEEYAFLSYNKLLEDLPIIDISKRAFSERLQKMVILDILKFKLIKENGTYTIFGFGKNYENLIKNMGYVENGGGCSSNNNGVAVQTTTKNKTIIKYKENNIEDKSSILKESENFDEFWQLYPLKRDKAKCQKKYMKIKESQEVIINGLNNYIDYIKREHKENYIKYPLTWLNGECWNDEYNINTLEDDPYAGYIDLDKQQSV